MENNQNHTTAKDFFLHLGAIVALYTTVISFLNLVFKIINEAYPEVATYYGYFRTGSEISLPVATLLIVFPIFILLSYFVHKTYNESPEKKDLPIRKWLTYITLFVAGIILAGDLVTVLYKFLDGQDLTLGFLLKALSVLLVSGLVFGYYLNDIREKIPSSRRKFWAIVSGVVILVFIILGFSVIGSPQTQRLMRYDDQKISDLQNLQYQVINYWQMNGMVPENWPNMMVDSQSGKPYEYKKVGEMSFELCAEFNRENMMGQNQYSESPRVMQVGYPVKGGMMENDNWAHGMGMKCFQRVIDPIAYPTQVRG